MNEVRRDCWAHGETPNEWCSHCGVKPLLDALKLAREALERAQREKPGRYIAVALTAIDAVVPR